MIGAIISSINSAVQGHADRRIAEQNIALQHDTNRQIKEMEMLRMGREDSALQRRIIDAKKAGINPIYALGAQGASSSAGSLGISSPHHSPVSAPRLPELEPLQTVMGLIQQKANIAQTAAQTELLKMNAERSSVETMDKLFRHGIDKSNLKSHGASIFTPGSASDLYNKKHPVHFYASHWTDKIIDAARAIMYGVGAMKAAKYASVLGKRAPSTEFDMHGKGYLRNWSKWSKTPPKK